MLYYAMEDTAAKEVPGHYKHVLTKEAWDDMVAFCADMNFGLMFTVNCGPGPRNGKKEWDGANFRALAEYAAQSKAPVAVWEFGNELNGYIFTQGLKHHVSARQYAKDFQKFRDIAKSVTPNARVAGPATAFWPVTGQTFPNIRKITKQCGRKIDALTWHYYPTQSDRGPVHTRKAKPYKMLKARRLDYAAKIARKMLKIRDVFMQEKAEVWLGETGNAQFGGQKGISDRYIAGLWWLDELGLMAKEGIRKVVRQTLIGSDYGILNFEDGAPNPDYWNSLLWKQLMGPEVYQVAIKGKAQNLRAYMHSTFRIANGRMLLLINLSRDAYARVSFPRIFAQTEILRLGAENIFGREVFANGKALELQDFGRLNGLFEKVEDKIELPPLHYAFVRLSN